MTITTEDVIKYVNAFTFLSCQMISFMLPKFSRALGAIQRKQFDSGKVQKYGQIVLEDGTLIEPTKVYNLPLTFEIRDMLKRGLLMGGSRTWVGR